MRSLDSIERRVYAGLNYRLRTFARGRFASACRPTSIALLMGERCNARCIYCDIWKNSGGEDSPSYEQWQAVLRDPHDWLFRSRNNFEPRRQYCPRCKRVLRGLAYSSLPQQDAG